MSFIPLHINSCYSILKSNLTIEKIIKNAQKNNFYAVALTDFNSLIASVFFFDEAKKKNIKPIIGLDLIINNDLLTFIIKNENGYHNLLHIFKLFNSKQLTLDQCKDYNDGLFVIISSKESHLSNKFKKLGETNFNNYLKKYQNIFEDFYIGIEIYNLEEKEQFKEMRFFLKNENYKLVAFPLIRYEKKEEEIIYEILQAIKNDQKIKETKKTGFNYFYNQEEINKLYETEEINNTEIISKNINFNLIQKRNNLINFTKNDDEYLKEITYKLLQTKIKKINSKYSNRLNYELDTIKNMNFSSYFLIVMDYINFAKKSNIFIGPGRGSIGGSLVAYALGITTIDPIKANLIFERFLNPDQKKIPDIDVDFEDNEREKIIQYIKEKYGKENVGNILTIQTIKAKQALRDIGHLYEVKDSYINFLCKEIKNFISLKEAYEKNQIFKNLINKDNYFKFIFETACKIENLPRQISTHAAGIIINNESLSSSLPIYHDTNNQLIGMEKDSLEKIGFIKFDILGLKNLSIFKNIVKDIEKYTNITLKYETIPDKDKDGIHLINKCETIGLFQLESAKIKEIIKKIKPNNFDDVVSLIAICRPGPIKFVEQFIKRKNNDEKITYCNQKLINVLKPTYGIIIFQEQIIEIINIVTNLSFSKADLFRRAMLKKNSKTLKEIFIKKAISNDFNENEGKEIFEFISNFCNYSFNKSHAYLYAKLTCQMAYLKAHYPIFFYKNILNNNDDISVFYEMQKKQIYVALPNINKSTHEYIVIEDHIFLPLTKINEIPKQIVLAILEERKKGTYKNFIDFIIRNIKIINVHIIQKLINSGCFDDFNTRSDLLNSLDNIIKFAQLTFNMKNKTMITEPIIDKNTNKNYFVDLINEFYCLGMILSKNFVSFYEKIKKVENTTPIIEVKKKHDKKTHKIIGIIETKSQIQIKNNKTNMIITINDGTDNIDVIFFNDLYQKIKNKISDVGMILITGIYDFKYNKFKCCDLINFYEKINNN